jgi:hypothetical protein
MATATAAITAVCAADVRIGIGLKEKVTSLVLGRWVVRRLE